MAWYNTGMGVMDMFGESEGTEVPKRTRRVMRDLDKLLGLGGGESVVTGQTPLEGLSLTGLENQAQGVVSGEGETSQQFELGRNTLADVLTQAGPALEEYFAKSVRDPIMQLFTEKMVPQLDTELARSGFFGTARARGLDTANEKVMRSLTEQKAGLAKDLLGLRLTGAGLATQQAGAERESDISTLLKTLEAGDTQRQKELQRIQLLFGLGGLANQANAPLNQFAMLQEEGKQQQQQQLNELFLNFAKSYTGANRGKTGGTANTSGSSGSYGSVG